MKVKLFLLTMAFISAIGQLAQASDSERIKGVSEFLLDRANDNYLYVVEQQIKKNTAFERMFPATFNMATSGVGLKALVMSGHETWEGVVHCDLKALLVRSLNSQLDVSGLIDDNSTTISAEDGNSSELKSLLIGFNKNRALRTNENPDQLFVELLIAIRDAAKSVENKIVNARGSCKNLDLVAEANSIKLKWEDFANLIKSLKEKCFVDNACKSVVQNIKSIANKATSDALSQGDKRKALLNKIAKNLEGAVLAANALEHAYKEVERTKCNPFIVCAAHAVNAVGMLAEVGLTKDVEDGKKSKKFQQLKSYVVAFASLADADTAEQSSAALQALTLPSVSFAMKRETDESMLFVSSYVGASWGKSEGESSEDNGRMGVFAPVGVELSTGWQDVSIMYAPFDFAYPINLSLHDKEADLSWRDVVRHTLTISQGFDNYPIAWGVAVSKGAPVEQPELDDEWTYSLFLAFDMPLFHVW